MANSGDWLEELVLQSFPGAKKTRASGATWHDGDLSVPSAELGMGLSIEAKDQVRVSFDTWWSQTRRQALRFAKVPVLVIRRPPAQLDLGRAVKDEILAICPLGYFRVLHETIQEAQKRINELERKLDGTNKESS